MPVAIEILGGFGIHDSGGEMRHLSANRMQALFGYLGLRADKPVSRSEVAFKLWPDSSEEQAHTNLRKTLHLIRHALGDAGPIEADGQTIRLHLSRADRLDLADFESDLLAAAAARRSGQEQAERAALEAGLARYGGDLLPNCYDDWLTPERDRLRQAFIEASDRLIEILGARQEYARAIQMAQRLVQADNLREQSHRVLIRLQALNDDRAAALNAYHACARILSSELGVEPDATTRELYEGLLKSGSALLRVSPPTTPLSHPLVGRDREWAALLKALTQPAGGKLRMILISGEGGIGKSRVAEDLLRWAQRQGIRTAAAACYPAEEQLSYAPVSRWLRALPLAGLDQRWRAELSRILPELRSEAGSPTPITQSWQKQVFFEAMGRALLEQTDPRLILLDDIHWCDPDTLTWLRFFLRSAPTAPLQLVVTLRTEELAANPTLESLLLDLCASDQLIEVPLGRLDRRQTDVLGAHILGHSLSDSASNHLFQASEGVPLFVVELAREGLPEKVAPEVESARGGPDSLPPRLRAAVEARLSRLSTPARSVAESAAIMGREFDLGLLRQVSELDEGTTISALDELWRRRLIRERGAGLYDFSHEQLREVTLANISPVRARWLHQRAAEVLATGEAGERLAIIADHFERAGLGARAAGYYAAAARREREFFALGDALEHLDRAIRMQTNEVLTADLHEERGGVLQLLGRREDAFRAFGMAFGLAQGHVHRARLARKQITVSSRFEPELAGASHQLALEELERGRTEPDYWSEWLETGFAWMEASYWQQDAAALEAMMQDLKQAVADHGTELQRLRALHLTISGIFVTQRYRLGPEHVAFSQAYASLARSLDDPYELYTALRVSGMVALCADDWEAAQALLRESIQLCEKTGDCDSLLIAYTYLSLVHRRAHQPGLVRADTRVLQGLLGRTSQNPAYEGVAHANEAWLAFREGNIEDASRQAAAAIEHWSAAKAPYPFQWSALFVHYGLAVEQGDLPMALGHAAALLAPPQQRLAIELESALGELVRSGPPAPGADRAPFSAAVRQAELAGYL